MEKNEIWGIFSEISCRFFLTNLLLFHEFLQSGEQLLKRVCKQLKNVWELEQLSKKKNIEKQYLDNQHGISNKIHLFWRFDKIHRSSKGLEDKHWFSQFHKFFHLSMVDRDT